jgi:glycosyltransferase involved in cell wall biosynthesis
MIAGKRALVFMPAYNAGRTLEQTYGDIPIDVVDGVVLVDDKSEDNSLEV